MFIFDIGNASNNNQQLTTEQWLAKIAEIENQNNEYKTAYNQKAEQARILKEKNDKYEAERAAANQNQNQNVEGSPFATDQSVEATTRRVMREEMEAMSNNQTKGQAIAIIEAHLMKTFRPAVQNVRMETLVQKAGWQAELIMNSKEFKDTNGHLPIYNQLVIAYDMATAGSIVEIVNADANNNNNNNNQNFNNNSQNQSDYGNRAGGGSGGGTNHSLDALKARRAEVMAALNAGKNTDSQGKFVDDNEIMRLDMQITQELRKSQGLPIFG